ncbi:anti-sigma U factor RsuA [Kitasatospora albolonga]|uniref:anti-sigma factor family protein n=1 Tax=Kitasatospora albolonga TaxID=68173 RepID=UPI0031E6681F
MTSPQEQHLDVGAYVLGLLEPEEMAQFATHLAGCARCTAEADELSGLEPLLAEYAEAVGPAVPTADDGRLLERLTAEVTAGRRAARTRRLFLVAAAVAVLIGGPLLGASLGGSEEARPVARSTSPAQELMDHGVRHSATDASTGAVATVALEDRKWGTHVALQLAGVRGPLSCSLIAVGRSGEQQTVTSWAVPPAGYGLPGQPDSLITHGGVGLPSGQIDHFEVRTSDGTRLVAVPV